MFVSSLNITTVPQFILSPKHWLTKSLSLRAYETKILQVTSPTLASYGLNKLRFGSRQQQASFLFSETSKSALGRTQSPL
jgi:ABC-type maltose transport system permease subunit